ncbi:MAG: hypothetical protein HY931_01695 [Candidatus Falkowbacteria bacterium]|nr:MAG: hypothetical protein HY931_01695 [Candidatus Falkowbacteria bacterium]
MDKAQNGLNGHATNGMKKVLADEIADNEAAQVMDAIRGHLPKLKGKSKEKVIQGVTNFLENNLKLTHVKVNVVEFDSEFRIFPSFSLNGSVVNSPGKIIHQKVAAAVYS